MKLYEIVTGVIGLSLTIWVAYGFIVEGNIEHPPFKIISTHKQFEIREYKQLKTISAPLNNQNSSFRQLFQMIDGNNKSNQKIPMTAPVIQSNQHMMFVLPNDMKDIPIPNNPNLSIKHWDPLTVAVLTFYGNANQAQKKVRSLVKSLKKENISITESWLLCQYNSPWTFPLLRKNEIWIILK